MKRFKLGLFTFISIFILPFSVKADTLFPIPLLVDGKASSSCADYFPDEQTSRNYEEDLLSRIRFGSPKDREVLEIDPTYKRAVLRFIELSQFERLMRPIEDAQKPFAISVAIHAWAQKLNTHSLFKDRIESFIDNYGNILIRVRSKNGSTLPGIAHQGHLDMYPDTSEPLKAGESYLDFFRHGVREFDLNNGKLSTRDKKKSLGADNLFEVASMIEMIANPDFHGRDLEFIFTTDEETTFAGAMNFSWPLKSQYLLNLDGEIEGEINVTGQGCSILSAKKVFKSESIRDFFGEETDLSLLKLHLSGLDGGHSGIYLREGRKNAILLGIEFLSFLSEHGIHFALNSAERLGEGGFSIPKFFDSQILVKNSDREEIEKLIEKFRASIDFTERESKTFKIETAQETIDNKSRVLKSEDLKDFLKTSKALLNGPLEGQGRFEASIEKERPGSSVYDFALKLKEGDFFELNLASLQRADTNRALAASRRVVNEKLQAAKFITTEEDTWVAWDPDPRTRVLSEKIVSLTEGLMETRPELNFSKPQLVDASGSLELAYFVNKNPGIIATSLSVQIDDAHSSNESVDLYSGLRLWVLNKEIHQKLH